MNSTSLNTSDWNSICASIPGSGHIRRGIPCQDASLVDLQKRPIAIVCDGRGSAKLSHIGANAAVKAFKSQIAILDPQLSRILDNPESTNEKWHVFCKTLYRALMQVKLDLAQEYEKAESEFDFTVSFAVLGQNYIGCFQVGDGAIVLRQNGKLITAFAPDKGEFANQTHYLRDGGECKNKFKSALFSTRENSGIAITSDGPEYLMFTLSTMEPGDIFNALFNDFMEASLNKQGLMDYLTRNKWNEDPRGADDRSIALIVPKHTNIINAPETLESDTHSDLPSVAPSTDDSSKEVSIPSNIKEHSNGDMHCNDVPESIATASNPQTNVPLQNAFRACFIKRHLAISLLIGFIIISIFAFAIAYYNWNDGRNSVEPESTNCKTFEDSSTEAPKDMPSTDEAKTASDTATVQSSNDETDGVSVNLQAMGLIEGS